MPKPEKKKLTPTILDAPRTRKPKARQRVIQPLPESRVQGAFGKPGRLRHPIIAQTVTDPRFISRAAREKLHEVSHS